MINLSAPLSLQNMLWWNINGSQNNKLAIRHYVAAYSDSIYDALWANAPNKKEYPLCRV